MKVSTIFRKNSIWHWVGAVFWLAVWQLASVAIGQPLLLPSPASVAGRLLRLAATGDFWAVTLGSLCRIGFGFLLGMAAGTLLAALTAISPLAKGVISLPMGIIRATPVASFVILALLFIRGSGFSVLISFIMVLPVAWSNVAAGIEKTDPMLLEMAQVYRFSPGSKLRNIYLPCVLPYLAAAARVGLGFAWKSGIAGEVIATPARAIGTQLYNAKVYLETADLFAWTVTIVLLSMLLERLTLALLGRFGGGKGAGA